MMNANVTHTKAVETAKLPQRGCAWKDALTIAVTDHMLREEFRKMKGADNTLAK